MTYAAPALFAVFAWWFSTGAIILLDNLPRRTFPYSMAAATALLAVSLVGLGVSAGDATVGGAYRAFTWALLSWAWLELGFYTGFVTGLPTPPCEEGCSGWKHLGHAIRASIWHELAILALAAAVASLTWHGVNHVGLWTFVVLWWMHQSAKLNVLLGVPNVAEEFLPAHMDFLRSFLARKPMNFLFPVSITVSTILGALLVARAVAPDAGAAAVTGSMLLAALLGLAIAEHWFLVVPLPVERLWRWNIRRRGETVRCEVEVVAGFLGAGKTTYLRRLLAEADPGQRTLVLVNDFAALGIDGALLRGRGADVVELPNGCICCSLRQDLPRQLAQAIARHAPRRVLIEPSGVADLGALLRVLKRPDVMAGLGGLRVSTVLDAGSFLRDYARRDGALGGALEAQARLADVLVLNKTDLVSAAELRTVRDTLRACNPAAVVREACYGILADPAPADPAPADAATAAEDTHLDGALTSWSGLLGAECDQQTLRDLLDAAALGAYGRIERVKGIARAGSGWVHFDLAGGHSSMAAFTPTEDEAPRVVAIGRALDETRLRAAFDRCALPAT